MKEENQIKISIPKPCNEDWDRMTPNEQGSFCGKCCKTVIDFSSKSDEEIKNILLEQQGKKICGRFMNYQLDEKVSEEIRIDIPLHLLPTNIAYSKRFIIALIIVFGTSLFSCTTTDNRTVGDISVSTTKIDSLKAAEKIKEASSPKETHLLGDTIYTPPKPPVMGKPKVEKCSETEYHMKGEVVMVRDTTKKTVPKDSTDHYPKMGKVKYIKDENEAK